MRYAAFVIMLLPMGCGGKPATGTVVYRPPIPIPTGEVRKAYSREEFSKKVMGKTMDEVKAVIGKPDRTGGTKDRPAWHYDGITVNSVSERQDNSTEICFTGGLVDQISY